MAADETANVKNGCASYCTAYLWIVPAKVEGTWQLPQGELTLKQSFQMLSGTLKTGNNVAPIKGKVTGDQFSFTAGDTEYQGRVSDKSIDGSSKSGGSFKASRAGK